MTLEKHNSIGLVKRRVFYKIAEFVYWACKKGSILQNCRVCVSWGVTSPVKANDISWQTVIISNMFPWARFEHKSQMFEPNQSAMKASHITHEGVMIIHSM